MNNGTMIEVVNLTKRYAGHTAVADISFTVARGELVGLLGENGAGKSTLMKLLCGIYAPQSGRIVVEGRHVKDGMRTLVVPGSFKVKDQAEAEGLDKIFTAAGFDWREPGCSMCLAMNPDKLAPGERAASTSNRNFEGRQGRGGRTHLVSPAVAAATAIAGTFATPDDLEA